MRVFFASVFGFFLPLRLAAAGGRVRLARSLPRIALQREKYIEPCALVHAQDRIRYFVDRVFLNLGRHIAGSRSGQPGRKAGADSRRSRLRCQPWSEGFVWCSSAGSQLPGRFRQ